MNKLVDKQVRINLAPFKRSPFMLEAFKVAALDQAWSETEVALAINQTNGLSLDDKYDVLNHYCMTYGDNAFYIQEDVQFMLGFLNQYTHYLYEKPIGSWDAYDFSNFNSLKRKATSRVKRMFAHFSDSVKEEDKYTVETPPSIFYHTLEEALEAVPVGQETSTNIYALWIKE